MTPGILSYGCSSAAGRGVESLWQSLLRGERHSSALPFEGPEPGMRAALWPESIPRTAKEALVTELLCAWHETLGGWSGGDRSTLRNLGVILASSKGCVDDFIWAEPPSERELGADPFTPVLEEFLLRSELRPSRSISVSNACSSALSALWLARSWLRAGAASHVLVLAADRVGPFVARGFHSLRALGPRGPRPFSGDRDGLMLGEAAAAILLSLEVSPESPRLSGIGIDAEGHAVTRAEQSGDSLRRACLGTGELRPELVIAHGTATLPNDAVEDRVFSDLFGDQVPVTATKGCIGHTLAASGAMDLIAACEVLKRRRVFRIAGTAAPDPSFKGRYVCAAPVHGVDLPARSVLVSSLGFGGIHAAARISVGDEGRRPATAAAKAPGPIGLRILRFDYEFPVPREQGGPAWKDRVDRWYQLDASAYGLCAAYWSWKENLGAPFAEERPSLLVLASPGASNRTDRLFAESGGTSPARFAHTLPNVRSSPLSELMKWNGPMLCLQRDPDTAGHALREAVGLLGDEHRSIWVLSSFSDGTRHTVKGFLLGSGGPFEIIAEGSASEGSVSLADWDEDGPPCRLPGGYRIHRKDAP